MADGNINPYIVEKKNAGLGPNVLMLMDLIAQAVSWAWPPQQHDPHMQCSFLLI